MFILAQKIPVLHQTVCHLAGQEEKDHTDSFQKYSYITFTYVHK